MIQSETGKLTAENEAETAAIKTERQAKADGSVTIINAKSGAEALKITGDAEAEYIQKIRKAENEGLAGRPVNPDVKAIASAIQMYKGKTLVIDPLKITPTINLNDTEKEVGNE